MHAPDLERFLHVRRATAPSFGPDGDRLAFLYDATGVAQAWTLDGPGRWPVERTVGGERVTAVDWSPTRDELVVATDAGGNERDQLLRVDLVDGTTTALTDRPDAIHAWGAWSHDGDRLAYTANRRDPAAFDVHVQSREGTGEASRRLREGARECSVAGWSPDDDRLAVLEARASFDLDVHVVDVETGEAAHVTPHDGDVRYGPVAWGPRGDALYVVTDHGADVRWLARLDLETFDLDPVVEPGDWSLEGLALHPATGRLATGRNVDGYAAVSVGVLADPTTVEPLPSPDLPDGVVGGLTFSPDGDRLALVAEGRRDTADVHVVDVATGATTRWTRASTAGLPRDRFVAPDLVRYETFDGRAVPAFLSLPPAGDPPHPVVVDVHGGPESQRRPGFLPRVQQFLHAGYAVFEPNVRGSTGYGTAYSRLDDVEGRLDSVADLAAGVEWLAGRDDVDADRVAACGRSYGGFMVLSALTEYPDLWAAGVDVVGIANFVTFLERTGDWRRARREAEYGSLADDRDLLERISPLTNIDAVRAPLLVIHGANDPRVPVAEAEQVAAAAAEHVPVETLVFDDEGHQFGRLENRLEAARATLDFLEAHVGAPPR